ncbi:MAG: phage head closure protein [Opitutaceae bacterium]|nr:phage head closure protein [Opitutaceae bacterium]
MNPGTLDRWTSLRRLETTIDSIGGVVCGWTHVAFVWAQKLPEKGREFTAAQSRIAEAVGVLRIRYRSDVAATWRVFVRGLTTK